MIAELKFHPLANIFPLIEGTEFDDLVADIKVNGLHDPIVIHNDLILDGRNRYRACLAAGVDPAFVPYRGDDPVAFVISVNLRRRHLDESQRAMVAAKLATLKRGDNQHSPIGETSQAKAAELLNVGKRSVERAAEVRDHGADRAAVARPRASSRSHGSIALASSPRHDRKWIGPRRGGDRVRGPEKAGAEREVSRAVVAHRWTSARFEAGGDL